MSARSGEPPVSRSPGSQRSPLERHDNSKYMSDDGNSSKYFGKMLTIRTSNYKSMFGLQPLSNYDSQESIGMGSFTMNSTPAPPHKVPVEALLNYLSENISKIKEGSAELAHLEELTAELLVVNQEVKIMRILKDNGWVGSRYQLSGDHQLDLQLLLQALSNYYLRVKKLKISNSLFNLLGPDADSRGLDKIVPFCPDMLLSYLRHNQFPPPGHSSSSKSLESVPCISFTGACMLVDISGFSKFSGAMCSKGVHGLDELRHATNGFLGHFVRIVYDFDGDVIAFAGDALICVFKDLDKPQPPSMSPSSLPPKPNKGSGGSVTIANCCFRAMQCAAVLKHHEASSTMTNMSLSTHIGLSYGDMKMALLGGLNDQYVFVMNGQCVSALSSCVTDAQSKQVVATRQCLDYALEYGDVNCSEVKNSTSTSGFPNILIEDDESIMHSAQTKRSSFHERVGIVKKYSVYFGSAHNGHVSPPTPIFIPRSSIVAPPESAISPTAVASAKAAAALAEAVADDGQETADDPEFPVMLKNKTNAINISDDMTFSLPNEDDIAEVAPAAPTVPKKSNGISFSMEKSNTGHLSLESDYSASISTGPLSDPSPGSEHSKKYQSSESMKEKGDSKPSSRLYSNPQSSIYIFDKQHSERRRNEEDEDDDGIYQSSFVENIAMFVPMVILAAACNGTMDTLGELRQVTTVFIELKSYDPVKHADPRSLQPFFWMAQQYLHESGGFLRQFLVDDKGCVLIAMWGTPSFTYSNNSCRALHFAVSINKRAVEIGHCCSVGVTTGTVFCGTVGANERCDYVGVGTDVNMAARLMCKADGGVLVDRLTYQSFNQDMKDLMTEQKPMHLKGSPEPVTPYKYTSATIPNMRAVDDLGGKTVFLKRRVMTLISEMLDRQATKSHLGRSSSGNLTAAREFTLEPTSVVKGKVEVLVVTGATGTGKTVAAHYFRHASVKQGMQVIDLKANSALSAVPYGIIKELFFELLPIGKTETYAPGENNFLTKLVLDCYPFEDYTFRDYVTKQLEMLLGLSDESNTRNHDLLNRLSNNYSESSVNMLLQEERSTASLSLSEATARDDTKLPSMSSIIYQVLVVLLAGAPCSLIIENYHFCDELSWYELLEIISRKDQALTMCIMVTIRTAPLEMRTMALEDTILRPSSLSPTSNRQSMQYNFKGLSQTKTAALSLTNLEKSSSSSKLQRPHSLMRLADDLDETFRSPSVMEESFRALLKLPETTLHELTSLTHDEVMHVLVDVLGDGHVTEDLVSLVSEVSAGNIYWCKSIAHFIKERDISEFKDLLSSSKTTANPLRDLVLCRMERLSPDLILILKHVSVIGHEFNEALVQGIMNSSAKQRKGSPLKLSDQLIILEKSGFIYLLEEFPVPIYGFQNELIRNTLYELLPPGDASAIHCHIAQYLEKEFAEDLRPFYPTLAYNFSMGGKAMRHLAFKYQMKAANHAINHGAYNDGLVYTQAAEELVEKKVEYIVLIEVVQHAINDLTKLMPKFDKGYTVATLMSDASEEDITNEYNEHGLFLKQQSTSPPKTISPRQASHLSNQYSRSFYCEHESDLKQKITAYQLIKSNCEDALNKLRERDNAVPIKSDSSHGPGSANSKVGNGGKKKDIRSMLMRKNTSHKLSWQLSTALPQGKYGSGSGKEKTKRGRGRERAAEDVGGSVEKAGNVDDVTMPVTVRADSTQLEEEEGDDGLHQESTVPMGMHSSHGCCIIS